jgi:flagellar protein FliO/FliZ
VRQVAVGTRERIAVVQAGDEQFLVGITTQSVNLISRLDKPITEQVTEAAPFANQLTQLLKKDDKK